MRKTSGDTRGRDETLVVSLATKNPQHCGGQCVGDLRRCLKDDGTERGEDKQ